MAKLTSLTVNDTGALTLPVGTTAQRVVPATTVVSFTSTGAQTWTCPSGVFGIEVLVVAGGGGGSSGGGGGGGVVYRPYYPVRPGTVYNLSVGAGGAGATTANSGSGRSAGGNSTFDTITAYGGGYGGINDGSGAGGSGGSGGGGGATSTVVTPGGAGTAGQGFSGGTVTSANYASPYPAAGGGGAGGPGEGPAYVYQNTSSNITTITTATYTNYGGRGGPGVFYNISGQERAYGGGGGGGVWSGGNHGAGGSGVGGSAISGQSLNGIANTGGGGGGNASGVAAGAGGSGIVIIRYNTTDSLGATQGAIRLNTTLPTGSGYGSALTGGLEIKQGDYWQSFSLPFLQRTIITNHYVAGGYKDGTPWTTVNRCVAATDTTTNLGDLLEAPSNYKNGACSKNILYLFGATSTNAGASNYIIAFNMRTEASYTSSGSRYLAVSTVYNGVMFKEHYTAFVHQGPYGSGIEEYNMSTETLTGTISATAFTDYSWAMSTENYGIVWASDGASNRNLNYATKTITTRGGTQVSAHHQQKSVNSKLTNCYAGNEGTYNGGNNYRRTNMITNITSGTVAKPSTNCGEENYTMGQDHQYMLGTYNGNGQVNTSSKFYYTSEAGITGSATLEPKGHNGQSSAITGWRD